jgi:agmatinase|tara:strand:+ start:2724 stop:3605 length:882 start_codon:yes stop_codon:yes gene_type:complete
MSDSSNYANPPAFHSDDLPPSPPSEATFHIIPVPWETSVSYGGGTANGPNAILHASTQLEAYIDGGIPGKAGLHTTPPVNCEGEAPEILARIRAATTDVLKLGKTPILLGGEHAMTLGPIQAIKESGVSFGVVQFDAHADLRDIYQGAPHSHACVMKRIFDLEIPIFQIGVRALSQPEADLRNASDIDFLDADAIARSGFPENILPAAFPENLFITFDVDGLDPSIMPSTGTPEPGGLSWYQALDGLENVMKGRNVIGADIVELAPVLRFHSSDFTAAKLVYKMMDLILKNRR